jgi:phage tail sheath gpL-like
MTVSNPIINITKAPAEQSISNAPQKVLIVGQQTGSVYTSGSLVESIGNANIEIGNFGKGSQISEMVKAFKSANQVTRLDAIALDDNGSGVQATGSVAFSGTATESGALVVSVGSRINHKYSVSIASGDTATQIGDALVALINADAHKIVSASNTTGTVTLTANNAGTYGNGIGLEVKGIVGGVTPSVTAMTGGATDPVLTGLFDVIGETRYQTIIFPGNYDVTVVADSHTSTSSLLDPRWNEDNAILDGVCVISKTDTLANLKTFLNSRNSQSLIVNAQGIVNDTLYKGSSIFELDDVIAAQIGAVRALRLTDGANIAQFVIASNLDARGGTHTASLPYMNTPLTLPVLDTGKGWAKSEQSEINVAGGFFVGNNVSGTGVVLGQVYTTYKTDAAGNVDKTYQFLNNVDVTSAGAEFIFNNLKSAYSQSRLTDGSLVTGYNMVNENAIRGKLVELYNILSGEGYLLYRAGEDNVKYFVDNLTISLDLLNGKATSTAKVPLVAQLRRLDLVLQAVFNI